LSTFLDIRDAIIKRLNTTTAAVIAISTLVGMGFTIGKFYGDVTSKGEIMELKNKHTLEIIELRNANTFEVLDLKKRINLLEIDNEKRKK
jgi:Na+/H+ antiporter NhaA